MSAPALRQWLNEYFAAVIKIIAEHDGHVVDLTGDAVLALWAPQPTGQTACIKALQAAESLQQLEQTRGTASRIGVHYGPVSFGEVGAGAHLELRAVGDAVNTTSRLQGANKQLGTRILISDAVATRLADRQSIRALGKLQLVGKQLPVDVYTTDDSAIAAWEQVRVLENK
jgi:adenylate cyclase